MKISENVKNKFNKFFPYILIFFATIFICMPLMKKELNMFKDDGIQHICRLMGTYQSIKEGQTFPIIMSNFCNGFGYSWNLFYSPLTAFVPLLFKVVGLSFTNCIKIFMCIIVYLSGIAMFLSVNKVTKNRNIATLAGILYIFAPYRITDMYMRNALAELASFVFLPMIFNGLYTIVDENKKSYALEIGIVGLILTHTLIAMYMAIICFIYLIVDIKKLKNRDVIKNLITNIVFALIITSFFWIPLIQSKYVADYEVFVPGRMEREDVLISYKVDVKELFNASKNKKDMIYAIGWVTIIGLLLTPFALKKIKPEYEKLYLTFLLLGIILTIMTLTFFPFEKLPSVLTMIQFTYRLFEFTSFLFAIVASINYGLVLKKFRIVDILVLSFIAGALLIPYKDKIDYKENDENKLWPAVMLTQNTGRVHPGMASMEYLPSKAFNNKTYIISRSQGIVVNSGNTEIKNFYKNGTNMEMTISNTSADTRIELPYIYYLGYNIKIEQDGKKQNLNYTESNKGFIEIKVPETEENINISVKYSGTKTMKIGIILAMFTIIGQILEFYLISKKKYSKIVEVRKWKNV